MEWCTCLSFYQVIRRYFFRRYDDGLEELVSYERIALTDLEKIEIGELVFLRRRPYVIVGRVTE